jgi:phosphomannomutase
MLSVSGCRGIVGASLTPDVICRFVGAMVSWLREEQRIDRPVVVLGCDGRKGGDVLRGLVGSALAAAGCRVIDLGTAMTPTIGVMVVHHRASAGLTLTASHNPAEWNGMKIISAEGAAPDAPTASRIIERFKRDQHGFVPADRFGSIERDAVAAKGHADRVLAALAKVADIETIRARRFKVVLDSLNASGVEGARLLLNSLNCELTHLHDSNSGVFPHPAEPTRENLVSLSAEVAQRGSDVGFAQDPDADRLAVFDEGGRYIGEEYTLVLGAMALLGNNGAPSASAGPSRDLVANLSTSRMIDDVARRMGATVHRSAVGEANVVSAMKRVGAVMGGEGNGGVIWPEVTLIRDSLSAMALTLALLARERKPLSAIVASTPSYAIEKRKIELRPGLIERALAAAEGAHFGNGVRIDKQDGVRLDFPAPSGKGSAWLHVRASNTEPILRLIAEAPSSAETKLILDRADGLIQSA